MEDEFLGVSLETLCIIGGSLVEETVDGRPRAPVQGGSNVLAQGGGKSNVEGFFKTYLNSF